MRQRLAPPQPTQFQFRDCTRLRSNMSRGRLGVWPGIFLRRSDAPRSNRRRRSATLRPIGPTCHCRPCIPRPTMCLLPLRCGHLGTRLLEPEWGQKPSLPVPRRRAQVLARFSPLRRIVGGRRREPGQMACAAQPIAQQNAGPRETPRPVVRVPATVCHGRTATLTVRLYPVAKGKVARSAIRTRKRYVAFTLVAVKR